MHALQYDPEFIVSFDCVGDIGQSLDDDKNNILCWVESPSQAIDGRWYKGFDDRRPRRRMVAVSGAPCGALSL